MTRLNSNGGAAVAEVADFGGLATVGVLLEPPRPCLLRRPQEAD
jgi:hypothetical protein